MKKLLVLAALASVGCGCGSEKAGQVKEMHKEYQIARAEQTVALDGEWDGQAWRDVEIIDVKHFMGDEPEYTPRTQAKLLYDEEFVYVIFRVEDRYVRAVAQKHQDAVCNDSCVEFFFTPGHDISQGYFNLEMNCGGIMSFNYQPKPWTSQVGLAQADCKRIDVFHSQPRIVDPEKTGPTTWVVQYRVPIDMLQKYFPESIARPGPGVTWRANFYKCADGTSHPHWLTWSVIDKPRPDFHVPEFFGTLVFK